MSEDLKKVKRVASGVGGACGAIMGLVYYLDSKVSALEAHIETKSQEVRVYVDQKDSSTQNSLTDIKNMLEKIDDRVYRLYKRNQGGSDE